MILPTEPEEVIRFFRNVMSCRIEVCEKVGKNEIRMAYDMEMGYHLHMASYFLENF